MTNYMPALNEPLPTRGTGPGDEANSTESVCLPPDINEKMSKTIVSNDETTFYPPSSTSAEWQD